MSQIEFWLSSSSFPAFSLTSFRFAGAEWSWALAVVDLSASFCSSSSFVLASAAAADEVDCGGSATES